MNPGPETGLNTRKVGFKARQNMVSTIHIEENLTYEEQPVEILDRRDQVLRTKVIPLVKVLWRNQSYEEATWEREEDMRIQYPHLFNIAGK